MDARKLHYFHHKLKPYKAWYFLLLSLLFLILAVYGLRSNYSKMVDLRQSVYQADQENGNVEEALAELRKHVYSHMNTDLSSGNSIYPPIQLKERYTRLAGDEQKRVDQENAQIAARAEQVCASRFPAGGFNAPRIECIQAYVSENAIKNNSVPDELYKFDFVSPKWSPDLAGYSLLFSGLFFVLFAARFGVEKYLLSKLD